MKISHGLMVVGLLALASLASAAELTTFQAGQVASASEVNGNFQRLAAEDEAIRADFEAAIEEGNARLDTAIEEGNAVLQDAITDGATQLETLQTQISALLEEVDGLTARLAQLEDGSAGSGSTPTTTKTAFSPVGTWSYLIQEAASGFNAEQTSIFNFTFGEEGQITLNADGTLSTPNVAGLNGGVYTGVNKGADGLVSLDGGLEREDGELLGKDVFPVEGTWKIVEKENGAAVTLTIFESEDGDRGDFDIDFFRGSDDFLQAVLLEEVGERNNAKGISVTTISFFRVSD